ncbi:DUF3955 domain-containing protein [Staphylococcus saprophyticus]|uniref:DUF3955 domain-containing protein n=1 Tax=Staphylococcus saprophyticus TaxID=29385 RepID=UPI001D17C1D6|nr:DUF3955 domain-containing protein [Staphylococcus saprophyticus]MCC4220692.1 DUF3955 domain-containing protein [Staphylococcus saprophyticus]
MNKKLFFASIISIVLGASLGISFLLIPSYVNENGILKEPWYLVESGFSFCHYWRFTHVFCNRWLFMSLF